MTKQQREHIIEAGKQAIIRQERLEALRRLWAYEERSWKEREWLKDDHIALDMPFFTEREN